MKFLQTRPPRNSAGLLSIPCGEADRPTSVEGGRRLQRTHPGSRSGPIKEMHVFNKEGSCGTDVKVPSTSNRESLIWVNVAQKKFTIVVTLPQSTLSF